MRSRGLVLTLYLFYAGLNSAALRLYGQSPDGPYTAVRVITLIGFPLLMLAAYLLLKKELDHELRELKRLRSWAWIGAGIVLVYLIEGIAIDLDFWLNGNVPQADEEASWIAADPVWLFNIAFAGPFLTDLLLRKVFFQTLYEKTRRNFGLSAGLVAFAYTLALLGHPYAIAFFVMQVMLSYIYIRTHSVFASMIVLIFVNLAASLGYL